VTLSAVIPSALINQGRAGLSQRTDKYDCDTVVIGAGAAGIAAGRRLAGAGLRVIIVEARDRIGGRVHTLRPPGWPVPVEAGAEFVHGQPAETWNLIHASHLAAYTVVGEHWHCRGDKPQWLDFGQVWRQVVRRLEKAADDELSFADFLARHCSDLSPEEISQAKAYVEGFNAANSRLISSRWVLDSDGTTGQASGASRIHRGYDGIIERLYAGIDPDRSVLRLATIVSAIKWCPGRVEVEIRSAAGTPLEPIHAAYAVITLPLGVLRAGSKTTGAVQFVPDLPQKWKNSEPLKVGSVVKLVLRFREAFWEAAGFEDLGFLHAPDELFQTWWTSSPMRGTILTGWVGGPAVSRLSGMTATETVSRALDSLARIFSVDRTRLASLLEATHLADWQDDPFARGAYSYVGVGGSRAAPALAEPVAGTLFFAGEATHDRLSGTVAGAIASGYRAADEVLQSKLSHG
jgi:monoamine oxidase